MLPSQGQGKKHVLYGVYWQKTVNECLGKLLVSFWKLVKYYDFYLHVYYLADLFAVFFAAKEDDFFLRQTKHVSK